MTGLTPDSKQEGVPVYRQIKEHIIRKIESGEWKPGFKIPSESTFVKDLGVSRMTVNRALTELANEGLLNRVQGMGSFVADRTPPVELLELRSIADEIRDSGKTHKAKLVYLAREECDSAMGKWMEMPVGTEVFHSIVVHMADGKPVQVEDRYVNQKLAPDYMSLDFERETPNEHLMRAAPPSEIEHIVEAVNPASSFRSLLKLAEDVPCLQLWRRTWCGGEVVTVARLLYPGNSRRFGTRFKYQNDGMPRLTAISGG